MVLSAVFTVDNQFIVHLWPFGMHVVFFSFRKYERFPLDDVKHCRDSSDQPLFDLILTGNRKSPSVAFIEIIWQIQ